LRNAAFVSGRPDFLRRCRHIITFFRENIMKTLFAKPIFHTGRAALTLFVLSLNACSLVPGAAPPGAADMAASAPPLLQPGESERAAFAWHATGSQIYECRASDKGGFGWAFVAPEAELFNQDNDSVGTHGAGPFWAALDGSRVVGTVKSRVDGAQASDIPLLLLSAKPATGEGLMAGITSVQRLHTHGGVAPASGCQTPAEAGRQSRQPYSADYVFFTRR
jgi:hypothetical protein